MGGRIAIAGVLVLVVAAAASLYTVSDGETVLRVQGERIVAARLAPGLHARAPFLDRIVRIDDHGYAARTREVEVQSQDGQGATVTAELRWRVRDPAAYLAHFGASDAVAGQRLAVEAATALKTLFAAHPLKDLVGDAAAPLLAAAGADLGARLGAQGLAVQGLELQRVDLNGAALEGVERRMQQGFQAQQATETEHGATEAQQLRAAADEQGAATLAAGARDAQRIRGEGEAQAAAIYARAWSANPEFAAFCRSLAAYRNVIGQQGDVLVLTPDGEFFKYLHNPARH